MALITVGLLSCKQEVKNTQTMSGLNTKDFVSKVDGKETGLYILRNSLGLEACITNYGGRLVSLLVPDRDGNLKDVVLGYGSIAEYLATDGNYGALIGRYGNRIKDGLFTLDGETYQLPKNNNGHCLHGGPKGFHTQVWDAEQLDAQTLKLTYLSKDKEAGFPGNLNVTVIYKLTDNNAIDIQYEATTDKATVVNLTNHSYFNLSGKLNTQILDHYVHINADSYNAVDETLIPVGIVPVDSTPMDLRRPALIRAGINEGFEQLVIGKGYDHNWVLNTKGDISQLAAKVYHDGSGIVMDVYTNEPGIQFYSGNFMAVSDNGKLGIKYPHRGALCLETQHYPNSPNEPSYPSTVLRPGEKYTSRCIYMFKTVPTPVNQ
ncbi:MAG TPA: galactose-1-epimerase [Porphyromonadaceae bacterium]|nr:galactose-1-epimerase [Porphyromonadaceae bacterium]